jgi:arylsulfatase A-like enzyme
VSARSRGLAGGAAITAALLALLFVRCGGDSKPTPGAPPAPAAYAADGCPTSPPRTPPTPRNVVLICLDTVRADALHPAAGPPLMPRLAAWAKTGVDFTNATSSATWTGPSVASILTGLPPSEHGARDFASFRLVDAVPTLPEVLRCARWHTIAYTGGVWVSEETGVLQGFEAVRQPFSFGGGLGAFVLTRLGQMHQMAPWFLFLHTYEAHDPYGAPPDEPGLKKPGPPPGVTRATLARDPDGAIALRFLTDAASRPLFDGPLALPLMDRIKRYFDRGFAKDPDGRERAAQARERYAEGVRRLDASVADFLEGADREGLLKDAMVIVTSDHGEGFGEHGALHHGRRLYDELLRVPLVVRAPGWPAGTTVDAPVSTLDLAPTVCAFVGLPPLSSGEGASLEVVVRGGAAHPCVAEELRTEAETGTPGVEALASVRDARWKWILTKERGSSGALRTEIYDLRADPGETRPLPGGPAVTPTLPFEEARGRRLRALGN